MIEPRDTTARNEFYRNLMGEAYARIECIADAVRGKINVTTFIGRELCYLQIRFLCELIALSCLVAHGGIGGFKQHRAGKAYSAEEMIEELEKLRPQFYPFPVEWTDTLKDGVLVHRGYRLAQDNPLPKQELLKVYGDSHRFVHRGSLRAMLAKSSPLDETFDRDQISLLARKFTGMLHNHCIAISETEAMLCHFNVNNERGRIQVFSANYPQRT